MQQLPGLQKDEIPLEPSIHQFSINSNPRCTVTRRQLPLTPGYAFTDIKSQGQTIDYVIVDIGKTTSFALSPTNAYVALSRSRGKNTIRLLCDFENHLFTRHPSQDLRLEDERLNNLAKLTEDQYFEGKYGCIKLCEFRGSFHVQQQIEITCRSHTLTAHCKLYGFQFMSRPHSPIIAGILP